MELIYDLNSISKKIKILLLDEEDKYGEILSIEEIINFRGE